VIRPIVYDATHLIARQGIETPTGIDRVDQAYAAALAKPDGMMAGITCALHRPRLLGRERVAAYADALDKRWTKDGPPDADPQFRRIRGFVAATTLTGGDGVRSVSSRPGIPAQLRRVAKVVRGLLEHDPKLSIPQGAIFLNVTQNPTLVPRLARMLARRPDLKAVFLIHDLIPMDHPEFMPADRRTDFARALDVMFRHAAAFIVTSEAVRVRLHQEFRSRRMKEVPVGRVHLPTPAAFLSKPPQDPTLAAARYVVMVGTIEPRKNHWFILNLWRRMIEQGDDPPRLVVVGGFGWLTDSVQALFARTPELQPYVLHVSGLSDSGLAVTLAHARALLMASFVEGFGIPVVEAASLGVPVIAGSHPVFAEISQGLARTADPLDGPAWRRLILEAAGPDSAPPPTPALLARFVPQTADTYFSEVRAFLRTL